MNDNRIDITIDLSSDGRMLLVHRGGPGVIIDTYQQEYVIAEIDRLINEFRAKMHFSQRVTTIHK